MTATLPIVEGGEVPIPVDAPTRRRSTRKRKTSARPAIVIEIEGAQPLAQPADTVLDRTVRAIFAGTPVQITAIGEKRVIVTHDQPLVSEGDLILRVAGLFPELSRLGGRTVADENGRTVIEITRNAIALPFALDAIRNPVADTRTRIPEREKAEEPKQVTQPVLLAPTRPLPATFGETRVALLEIHGKRMRVAHSKKLPPDGEHPFAIRTDVADFSGSQAHVVACESLQEGAEVYVSTIEITGNALSFGCGIDALVRAQFLQQKSAATADVPDIIEADPQPLPHPRDIRPPLVPIVRTYPRPPRVRRWNPIAVAAGVVLLIAIVATAYVKRPDHHLLRAQAMIAAYEDGLMPSERDYMLPVYTNALRELSEVRPASISGREAEKLADHIRRLIARQRGQRTASASVIGR